MMSSHFVLTGTRGSHDRARILEALVERPLNADQVAEHLHLDYETVDHHLDVLEKNGLVRSRGRGSDTAYLLTDNAEHHRDEIRELLPPVE